jgi:mRNA-degrading endonuclease HigB of HigAB toxin-antitoxin module
VSGKDNPQARRVAQPGGRQGLISQASILKAGRLVFNIKGNDYRLIARVQYQAGVLMIRFFGMHAEYDEIDAETVEWMQP